jgi:hypothetical protein
VSAATVDRAAAPSPSPPPPQPGSPRYFALLYAPSAARAALATLLALADEISAGAGRSLDHSVAHARLDWWRAEAARYACGEPQHPWLRTLLPPPGANERLDLAPLVDAAAIDLATATFGAAAGAMPHGAALQGAVFGQLGSVLRAAAGAQPALPSQQRALRDLGQRTGELERLAGASAPPAAAAAASAAAPAQLAGLVGLRLQVAAIDSTQQPPLAPLLVWVALVANKARRRSQREAGRKSSALDAFADNIVAWNAARRAARGRFRID